jgi:uncharacterized protein YraI
MKRMIARQTLLALSLALALPLAATARDAFVVEDVGLQAGPDPDYPSITQLPAGTEVQLQGCIEAYTWCDVIAGQDRGWVPGSYLEEEYENQRVLVIDYGPRIQIPVVTFSINVYWDAHYHNRPFYAQRETFVSRHITPHAVPKPAQVANRSSTQTHMQGSAQTQQTQTQQTQQQTRQTGTPAQTQTETRAQAETRTHQQQPAQSTVQQQQAPHSAAPAPTAQDQAAKRATAETRDSERNVPNVRSDQREGAHGAQHPMPPTVEAGNQEQRVASSKQEHADQKQAKQPPKSDKDKDKNKNEQDHDHDHDH